MRRSLLSTAVSAALLAAALPATSAHAAVVTTVFTEFGASAARVDADHDQVTFTGRVAVEADPAKGVANVPVSVHCSTCDLHTEISASTGADGRFAVTARLPMGGRYKALAQGDLEHGGATSAPVTVAADPQEAKLTLTAPPHHVAYGSQVVYEGQATRKSATGWRPAANVAVQAVFAHGEDKRYDRSVWTDADGRYRITLPAFADGSTSVSGLSRRRPDGLYTFVEEPAEHWQKVVYSTAVRSLDVSPEPVAVGGDAKYRFQIVKRTGTSWQPFAGRTAALYFRAKGTATWKFVETTPAADRAGWVTGTATAHRDGDWQARVVASADALASTSGNDYVDTRYMTLPLGFNAAPEPVRKGKALTLSGGLAYFFPKGGGKLGYKWLAKREVYFYFLPKGAKEWTYVGSAVTSSKGMYKRTATAKRDGTWRVYFPSDANLLKSHRDDYVDVR